jgi:adenylate kinase family enzyme
MYATWDGAPVVPHRMHVFGASGSGTTTLGRALSERIGGRFLDTDAYYWLVTDPPFTTKREPSDRVAMIERDIQGETDWVLSGSICSWGEPLLHHFTVAVFLRLDPALRMARIHERERQRYGERIGPGGDLRAAHLEFMDWARSYDHAKAPIRSLDLHERWMRQLRCPIIRLDSAGPVDELCDEVLVRVAAG